MKFYLSYIILILVFSFQLISSNSSVGTNIDNNSVREINQNDSLQTNKIENIKWIDEQVKFKVNLEKYGQPIKITIYNMLAKPVKSKDYDGTDVYNGKEYFFDNTSDLPQGHYFCVLVGNGFKDTKKFTITR